VNSIQTRSVTGDMIQSIGRLFETAFQRPFSQELYRWRFLENPFGPTMARVAFDRCRIVAHYGVCPVTTRTTHGESIRGALSMTTMTDPEYWGRGLFPRLAEELYGEIAREHCCRLVFGFPNPNSHYSITHRLGWNDVHALFYMGAPVPSKPAATGGFEILDWQALVGALPGHRFAAPAYQPCERSADFLAWRYERNPVNQYAVLAAGSTSPPETAVVVKEHKTDTGMNTLDIVDVIGSHRERRILQALRAALDYGRAQGFVRAQAWVDMHHPVFPVLERLRFQPMGPIRYFGVRWLSDSPPDATESKVWRISMGDSDVF
jgi:GNAT superfamily N-acetyltransferase